MTLLQIYKFYLALTLHCQETLLHHISIRESHIFSLFFIDAEAIFTCYQQEPSSDINQFSLRSCEQYNMVCICHTLMLPVLYSTRSVYTRLSYYSFQGEVKQQRRISQLKLHKIDNPIRSVLSNINAPTHNLAKLLNQII